MYRFDVQNEVSTPMTSDIDSPRKGNEVFQSLNSLTAMEIECSCMPLKKARKQNTALHVIGYNHFYQSPDLSQYPRSCTDQDSEKSGRLSKESPFFISDAIDKNDTIIYVVGDDTPVQHPLFSTVKMDAQWHSQRINALKQECSSLLVLIARNRYAELASTIMKECKPTNCTDEDVKRLSDAEVPLTKKSYFPFLLLSLGFVAIVGGFLYKHFYFGLK